MTLFKTQIADISTAFLFADLPPEERVSMQIPDGVPHEQDEIWELKRCIYGLKKSRRRFYETLGTYSNRRRIHGFKL